jgi:hypothetical protein
MSDADVIALNRLAYRYAAAVDAGDAATGTLLCAARYLSADPADNEAGVNVIRYVDRYERRSGEWRIADREIHFLWSERHPLDDGGALPADEQ